MLFGIFNVENGKEIGDPIWSIHATSHHEAWRLFCIINQPEDGANLVCRRIVVI